MFALSATDGQVHGPPADVRFRRGAFNDRKDFSIASLGDSVLVVWSQRTGSTRDPMEVWATELRCMR